MRAITTAALALLAALALGAPAEAKLRWRSCPEADGPKCTTIRVPLDRSGGLEGHVALHVARVAFARKPGSHMMYLSGGPGGAGVYEMVDVLFELPELTRRYTVIGFDQRGTGSSGLLRCKELERDGRLRSPSRRSGAPSGSVPSARSTRPPTPSRTWRRSGARWARGR